MANAVNPSTGPQLRSGPLITGTALVGAGALLALAGLAVGGSHLLSAPRAPGPGSRVATYGGCRIALGRPLLEPSGPED